MMKRTGLVLLVLTLLGTALFHIDPMDRQKGFLQARSAYAQDDWNTEFEDICSKTQDAMSFTVEELKQLVERCDRLEPSIEKLDDTRRKVYLKRLRMCKNLFAFALASKIKED